MDVRHETGAPSAEDVRSALERLLQSEHFKSSPRASRFIQFVVETALAGNSSTLKEYVLGIEVFDRAPTFDPGTDTIVRVEAVKLRKRLDQYYHGPGATDPVVISVPKGAYVPHFRSSPNASPATGRPVGSTVSIAVLPFINLSSEPANDFWANGLTEELTSVLSRVSRLRVISRTSAAGIQGQEHGRGAALAVALGAAMLLEGSVRRQSERVRGNCAAHRGRDGCPLVVGNTRA